MSLKITSIAIPMFATITITLAGCGAGTITEPADEAQPDAGATTTGSAQIRVIHAAPEAPAVDVYLAGGVDPLISSLNYGEATAYLTVGAGDYVFDIRAAGSPASSVPVYTTGTLSLADGDVVSAIAVGRISSTNPADRFRVLALADEFATPGVGSAIVRIVHAGSDAPAVDIDVNDDGSTEIIGLARFADTGASGIQVPANTALQIGIRANGNRVTAFTTPPLPDGAQLFVIATGLLSEHPRTNNSFSLLAVADQSLGFIRQNPTIYALHDAPDAPNVDIYTGGQRIVANLAFGELSAPLQVPPATYELDFYSAGAQPGVPAFSAWTPNLEPGMRYLAIATGFLSPDPGDQPVQLISLTDEFDLDNVTDARIRLVHASPDAPNVDISTVENSFLNQPVLAGNVPFAASTDGAGLPVPAALIPVGIAAAGSTEALATFHILTQPGLRAFVIAAGALTPGHEDEPFRILLVDTSVWPWAGAQIMPIAAN